MEIALEQIRGMIDDDMGPQGCPYQPLIAKDHVLPPAPEGESRVRAARDFDVDEGLMEIKLIDVRRPRSAAPCRNAIASTFANWAPNGQAGWISTRTTAQLQNVRV